MTIVMMRSAGKTGPPPPVGGAPSWFEEQTEKTWVAKANGAGQRVTDLQPSPLPPGSHSGICSAYSGGCSDQVRKSLILPANGGHTDYSGNEVYELILAAETPAWVRLTDPSPSTDTSDTDHDAGAYADGLLRAYHGWNRACYAHGKVFLVGNEGQYQHGSRNTRIWTFDRDSLGTGPFPVASTSAPWVNHGEAMPTWGGNIDVQGGPSAYDRVGDRVWNCSAQGGNSLGQSFWSVDATSYAPTQHNLDLGNAGNGSPTWMAIAYDLRILIVGTSSGFINLIDLTNPTTLVQKFTTGSPDALTTGVGAHYHQPSRAILCWHGYGTSIRKLKIPSDPFSGTWAWSTVTATGGGATPTSAAVAGTHGKFQLIEDMGNGQGALAVINATDEATYVYKLPSGELN